LSIVSTTLAAKKTRSRLRLWLERRRLRPNEKDGTDEYAKMLEDTGINRYRQVIKALNSNRVEYLVIGSFSGIIYNNVVRTGDLDIWVGSKERNIEKLADVLAQLGYSDEWFQAYQNGQPLNVVRLGPGPIDVHFSPTINRLDFNDCYPRRQIINVRGLPISFISQMDHSVQGRRDVVRLSRLEE
jgi:hypothetical protein